jgi:glyoxylase-like metal-dependent hydrolase (beta-lactamase superfamily II)
MTNTVLEFLTVTKTVKSNVTIHTISSPLEGEMSNAQLIETDNKLLLIDALQLIPHATELKKYVNSIGKPLDRVIVTHYHPDHWFGIASFKEYPIYALQEVIDRIDAFADFVLNYHRGIHGENAAALIPSEKVTPSIAIKEGLFDFDGITLNLMKILDTEAPCILVPELPEHGILFAQDLVYNGAYAYFGDRTTDGGLCLNNWIKAIQDFKQKNYKIVLPGHGKPTDSSIFDEVITYLEFVKFELGAGKKGEELIESIKTRFPNYLLDLTLVMSNYMLFEFQA